ncbi:MAG: hypothetical protein R3C49_01265 [Planctomycetaceae bacterium]
MNWNFSCLSACLTILTALPVANAQETIWIPTRSVTDDGATYTYNTKAPDYLATWLTTKTKLGGGAIVNKTIDGKQYRFVKQTLSWSRPLKTQVNIEESETGYGGGAWVNNPDLATQTAVLAALRTNVVASTPNHEKAEILALIHDGDQPPGLTYSESAYSKYWLPTVVKTSTGTTYTFDTRVPKYFGPWLEARTPIGGGEIVTKTINGKQYHFLKQTLSWSTPLKDSVNIEASKTGYGGGTWVNNADLATRNAVRAALQTNVVASTPTHARAEILALIHDEDQPPGLAYVEDASGTIKTMAQTDSSGKTTGGVSVADLKKQGGVLEYAGIWDWQNKNTSSISFDPNGGQLTYKYNDAVYPFPYTLKDDADGNAVLEFFFQSGEHAQFQWTNLDTAKGKFFQSGTPSTGTPVTQTTMTRTGSPDPKPGGISVADLKRHGGVLKFQGSWDWKDKNTSSFELDTTKNELKYVYNDIVVTSPYRLFDNAMGIAVLELELPDGPQVQFEWLDDRSVKGRFWYKGIAKTAQPNTQTTMQIVGAPIKKSGGAPVDPTMAVAGQSYWLGREVGGEYVFDQQLPQSLGDAIFKADSSKFQVVRNPDNFAPKTVNGTTYSFLKATVSSDYAMFDGRLPASRSLAMRNIGGGVGGDAAAWIHMQTSEPHVNTLASVLPARQRGQWFNSNLVVLVAPDQNQPDVRISVFGEGTKYWLGREVGDGYTFDVPIPTDTGKVLAESDPYGHLTRDPSIEFPARSVDGTECRISRASVSYDHVMFVDRGKISVNQAGGKNSWIGIHRGEPVGQRFTSALEALGMPGGSWKNADLLILATTSPKTSFQLPATPYCESASSDPWGRGGENSALATWGEPPQILGHYQNNRLTIAWQNQSERKSVKMTSYLNGGAGFAKEWTKDVPRGIERLAGFTGDGSNLYCMTSNSERLEWDPSIKKTARSRVLNLLKLDASGNMVWEKDLGADSSYHNNYFVYSPMVAGTGVLAYGDGKVAVMCAVNTEPDPKIKGRRHQSAFRLTVNASDGTPATVGQGYGWAHSFDQRVVFDGTDFVCLDLPDQGWYMAGGGLELAKMINATNTHVGGAKGWYAYIRNGDNNYSSLIMADFAAGPNGYVIPFLAQKNSTFKSDMDSRNVGMVHVVKNFDKLPMDNWFDQNERMTITVDNTLVDTKSRNGTAEGDVPGPSQVYGTSNNGKFRYTGVAWLTNYSVQSGITAACPKIFKFSDSRYLVLYEEWGITRDSKGNLSARNSYKATKGLVIDEYGNVVRPVADMGTMPLRFRDSLFNVDGKAAWVYFDVAAYQFVLCTIDENLRVSTTSLGFTE